MSHFVVPSWFSSPCYYYYYYYYYYHHHHHHHHHHYYYKLVFVLPDLWRNVRHCRCTSTTSGCGMSAGCIVGQCDSHTSDGLMWPIGAVLCLLAAPWIDY